MNSELAISNLTVSQSTRIYTSSFEQALIVIANYINNKILPAMLMYMMPPTIFISFLNNTIVILIFIFNKQVIQRITKSVRIYYVAISISDINDTITVHLRYFLGIVLFLETLFLPRTVCRINHVVSIFSILNKTFKLILLNKFILHLS